MERIGLREANQRFARVIRAVRRGESVTLLDRNKPIAVIIPLPASGTTIERLAAEGVLVLASKPGLLPPFRSARIRGGLSRAVIEDRREQA